MKNIIAYSAGYIDGDGCFYIGKQSNPIKYRSQIVISSTNQKTLHFFEENFGGKVRLSNCNERFENYKPIYQWQLPGIPSLELIKKLMPYLIEKKTDAEIFSDFTSQKPKALKELLIYNMRYFRKNINFVSKNTIENIRKTPTTQDPCEQDFAYLAGFIDAECNFGIAKHRPKNRPNFVYKIGLQCNNTKEPVFYWLHEKFGGSLTFCKRSNKNKKWNDTIMWRISGLTLSKTLPRILPFLKSKHQVCKKLIEFYDTTLPNGGDRQSDSFKKSYAEIISKRESIINEIHVLNSRGRNHI